MLDSEADADYEQIVETVCFPPLDDAQDGGASHEDENQGDSNRDQKGRHQSGEYNDDDIMVQIRTIQQQEQAAQSLRSDKEESKESLVAKGAGSEADQAMADCAADLAEELNTEDGKKFSNLRKPESSGKTAAANGGHSNRAVRSMSPMSGHVAE